MRENPFPGMNPYMEDPHFWQGVHTRLIAAIDSELSDVLPEDYVSRIEERVYVEGWDKNQYFKPDNAVVQVEPVGVSEGNRVGVAVLERTTTEIANNLDAPLTLEWTPRVARQRFVAIYNEHSVEELVAVSSKRCCAFILPHPILRFVPTTNNGPTPFCAKRAYVRKGTIYTSSRRPDFWPGSNTL